MPRYHFHLVSDCARVPDCDGVDLADAWAAQREAFLVVDELVKPGSSAQHRKWTGWSVQVVDDRGDEVLFVPVGGLTAGRDAERNGARSVPAAERTGARNAAPGGGDRVHRRRRADAYGGDNLHRTTDAMWRDEQCKELRRALAMQIDAARETARLSVKLIEQARTLPVASPSS